MKHEYNGYTGNKQWAIISELTEDEILEKYHSLIDEYIPFILLSPAFCEVCDEFRRNEKKFQMRAIRNHDFYNFEDGLIELYHPELSLDDIESQFFKNEEEQTLWKSIIQLKPIQKERLIKYYFWRKNSSQIAKEDGVSSQAVDKSLESAIENLKKFLI